eukprot:PhF_6_TR20535/c0_g1_i1/m.29642
MMSDPNPGSGGTANLMLGSQQQGNIIQQQQSITNAEISRRLENIAHQRILVEERLRQLALTEQQLFTKLVHAGIPASPDVILGHIGVLALDPIGARVITKLINEYLYNITPEAEPVLMEIVSVSPRLMVDNNGVMVMLKFLEIAAEYHITLLLQTLATEIHLVCFTLNGANCVLRMVDRFTLLPGLRALLTGCLRPRIIELMKDMHGCRVVQRCLEKWSNHDNQFIFVALLGRCREVSCDRHGCCIFQRCLEKATNQQRVVLSTEVLGELLHLVQDPFGNYIVQYLMDLEIPNFNAQCAMRLLHNVVPLACNKFSSNVVERCLRVAPPETFQVMLDEIMDPTVLPSLVQHQFGNYVVQTALSQAQPQQLASVRDLLGSLLPLVKRTPCGRKLDERINGKKPKKKKKKKAKGPGGVEGGADATSSPSLDPLSAEVGEEEEEDEETPEEAIK